MIVCCLLFLTGTAMLVLPQLTGMRYRFLPNVAFANGNVIVLDPSAEEVFQANSSAIFQEAIYPGVYIDDLQVGGMTREQAIREIEAVNEQVEQLMIDIQRLSEEDDSLNNKQ